MLNIGLLRYSIKVLKPCSTKEPTGAVKTEWQDYLSLAAGIKYGGGVKTVDNKEIFSTSTMIFITHYRKIDETMMITWNDRKYRITMIKEVGFREGLEISVERIND